jgi:YhcH/YjgK/YiaL family protein
MIVDSIENLKAYISLNPSFKIVAEFLKNNNLENLEKGRTLIKDTDVFVNIENVKGKSISEAVLEYHRKMIDIQIPINAEETYGYSPVKGLPEVEFNVENDIAKVPGRTPQFYLKVKPGQFVMFFPQDGHAPCIGEGEIHKAIFKVKY